MDAIPDHENLIGVAANLAAKANAAEAALEAETGKRTCERCHVEKPLDEEHYTRHNGYFRRACATCTRNEWKYRIVRENKRIAEIAAKKLAGNIKAPHVSELCEDMIASFGGLTEFVAEWKEQYDELRTREPGSKLVMDSLYSVAKLVNMSTQHRSSAPDVQRMSEEALEKELTKRLTAIRLYETHFEPESDGRSAETA